MLNKIPFPIANDYAMPSLLAVHTVQSFAPSTWRLLTAFPLAYNVGFELFRAKVGVTWYNLCLASESKSEVVAPMLIFALSTCGGGFVATGSLAGLSKARLKTNHIVLSALGGAVALHVLNWTPAAVGGLFVTSHLYFSRLAAKTATK